MTYQTLSPEIMKGKVCSTLLRIANSREHAYKASGRLTIRQMRAISRIRTVAGYFSTYDDTRQLQAVLSLESELLTIQPAEVSRFVNLRKNIHTLIQKAHEYQQTF